MPSESDSAELFRAIDAELVGRTIEVPQAPELCAACFSSVCADPQACLDEFAEALEYIGAPVTRDSARRDLFDALDVALHVPCPTPGNCQCLIDHDTHTLP